MLMYDEWFESSRALARVRSYSGTFADKLADGYVRKNVRESRTFFSVVLPYHEKKRFH